MFWDMRTRFFKSFHLQGENLVLFVTQNHENFRFRLFWLATFHFFKTLYKFLFYVNRIDKKCFLRHGNVIFSKSFHLQGEKTVLFVTQKSWKFPIFWLFWLATYHFFKTFYKFLFYLNRIDKKCLLRHGNVIFSKSFHLQGEKWYCL